MAVQITRKSVVCLLLAGLLAGSGAVAAPRITRIHYAEPANLAGLPGPGAPGAPQSSGPIRTSFEAYGRHFDLQLDSNDRLLRKLSSAERKALPAHALYA
ncbi:MAG TPA: hypothetical protein VF277_07620, partial [Steroidobacteraceae bacterium]